MRRSKCLNCRKAITVAAGVELVFLLNRFGVQITVIEMLDRILCGTDSDVVRVVTKDLEKTK